MNVTRSVHPWPGVCRIGTRVQVVRGFLVVEREGEGQRTGLDAVHQEIEHEIELNSSQGRIADREVPVREARNRKHQRIGDREGDVVAALRITGVGRAPADARGRGRRVRRRCPVRDGGFRRTGDIGLRVMPVCFRGGEREHTLSRRLRSAGSSSAETNAHRISAGAASPLVLRAVSTDRITTPSFQRRRRTLGQRERAARASGRFDSGGPAVRRAEGPVGPETLRRHLSAGLPLSESRFDRVWVQFPLVTLACRLKPAGRKSIGYRIVIADPLLGPEVERLHALDDLGGQLRRAHVASRAAHTATRCRRARCACAAPSGPFRSDRCAALGCRAGRAPPCGGRTRSGSPRPCARDPAVAARVLPPRRRRRRPRSRSSRARPGRLGSPWPPPQPPPRRRASSARFTPPLEPGAWVVIIARSGAARLLAALLMRAFRPSLAMC